MNQYTILRLITRAPRRTFIELGKVELNTLTYSQLVSMGSKWGPLLAVKIDEPMIVPEQCDVGNVNG